MSITERTRGIYNLSQALWLGNQDLVRNTLQTPFVQNLIGGTLHDKIFILLDQQDLYYERVVRPYRKFVLGQSHNGFSADEARNFLYNQIKSANGLGITPTAVTNNYINFIVNSATDLSSAVTSLLPCLKLYGFLTHALFIAQSPRYEFWIERHPPDKSARNIKSLEVLLNSNQAVIVPRLVEIFRIGLNHEVTFFSQFPI